jgi:hypothetical protein
MKLKKLDITNIASISSASIDFTSAPLSDSPIFLICGETGSGKSTILDAICLALYNKTPRLTNGNKTTETSYKEGGQEISIMSVNQLLKKGEKEGRITLLFEGADGSDYTAEWKCRVNRNGKLESENWSITDSTGKTDDSKGKARIAKMTEIIGLDYDEFCRTSMLAQGQFTQFLKAETKEKSEILEKITGTEIYAKIGTRIHQESLEAENAFKEANRDVDSVVLLSEEEKSAQVNEIKQIENDIEKNKSALTLFGSLLKAFETVEAAEKSIKASEETLVSAKSKFSVLTNDIAYSKAELDEKNKVVGDLAKAIESQKDHADMFANVQAIESHLVNVSKQENYCKTQKEVLENEKKTLEASRALFAELEIKKTDAEKTLDSKRRAITEAIEAKMALSPEDVEKERRDIGKDLKLIGDAGTAYATIQQREENIATEKSDCRKVEEGIEAELVALNGLKEKSKICKDAYEKSRDSYNMQAMAIDQAAVSLRSWLRETGEDICPVCHAKITSLISEQEQNDLLKPAKEAKEKAETEMRKADAEFFEASTAYNTRLDGLKRAKDRITNDERSLAGLKDAFAKNFSSLGIKVNEENIREKLEEAKKTLDARKDANEKAIAAVNVRQKAVDSATADRDKYQSDIYSPIVSEYNRKNLEIQKIRSNIDNAREMISAAEKSASESLLAAEGLISYPDWKKEWECDGKGFIAKLKEGARKYNDTLKEFDKVTVELKNLKSNITSASDVRERIIAVTGDFASVDIVPEKFAGNAIAEWGSLENRIRTALEDIGNARKSKELNENTLKNAYAEDGTLPKTAVDVNALKKAVESDNLDKSERLGKLKNIIEDDDKKQVALKSKIEARDSAGKVNARWKTLDDLFGGANGFTFKKIAQSYIMQDILNHANAYLRKIAPRYELTAQPGSLVILVEDNEDGVVRSGNTLSGGEGFVISLSLALGLSSLAENSISVDTLFIDEGFGTLSQEWLNSVMSALEKLNSSSGKHVGIISHIEDLQKRIPTVIEVKKKNATTSEVTVRG